MEGVDDVGHLIEIAENGLYIVIEITKEKDARLLHFAAVPMGKDDVPERRRPGYRLLELQLTGEDRGEYHGRTHRASYPGLRMIYESHADYRNELGRKLEFALYDQPTRLRAVQHYQFYDGLQTVRCWVELIHGGSAPVEVEYVSSFALTGLDKEGSMDRDTKMRLAIAHNSWQSELQWRTYTLPELGMSHLVDRSSKRIYCSNTGSWSSAEHIPMGVLVNVECGTSLYWQIEHNGSWHWEKIGRAHV